MTLTIGIATRGRAELVSKVATDTLRNCRADTRIVVLADADDDLSALSVPSEIIVDVQPRPDSVGEKWNRMSDLAPAQVYMVMNDYISQATPGFDRNILQSASIFNDGIGAVYQHLLNLTFPVFQAVTAKMFQIMGGIFPTYFPYWFADHWLDDICKMTGRYVYSDGQTVVHPRPGTGATQDLREPWLWATLYDALYLEREAIAERLFCAMHIPEWQKEVLRAQWPLVHQRSRMINDIARGMQGNAPHDERYAKIRAKAAILLQNLYQDLEKRAA